MDLLRACQRDGVLRMERDRRGALRVFPRSQIPAPARATTPSSSQVIEGEVDEAAAPSDQPAPQELPESTDVPGFADLGAVEEDESSAHITDTTAEMLARAASGDKTPRVASPPAAVAEAVAPAPGRHLAVPAAQGRVGAHPNKSSQFFSLSRAVREPPYVTP